MTNKKNNNGFMKSAFYGLTEYVTQGYYGMSLSLDEPFTSTYGIGNSAFLRSNFKTLFADVTLGHIKQRLVISGMQI